MKMFRFIHALALVILVAGLAPVLAQDEDEDMFTEDFMMEQCHFTDRYFVYQTPNPYFILEPGWQYVLEGEEEDDEGEVEFIRVQVTVLNETRVVDGVTTRVVEEREWIDDELYEVSYNYFAACLTTNSIFYFGEEVDYYEDGEIIGHEGAWLAGVDGAQAGIIMPGTILIGSRFMEEIAPENDAMDRGEIVDIIDVEMGGELFENVVVIEDSSALEPDEEGDEKYFAPGIGNIKDEDLELVEYGFAFTIPPQMPFKK